MRRCIFYVIFLVTMPVWLICMVCLFSWDIAQNFRYQINAGYNKLIDSKGNLTDVV